MREGKIAIGIKNGFVGIHRSLETVTLNDVYSLIGSLEVVKSELISISYDLINKQQKRDGEKE